MKLAQLFSAVVVLCPVFVSAAAKPIVIGHRGASGYRPEHTIEAYTLAIQQGADYIEPDLVMTKDGVLVARHEPVLTAVHPTTGAVVEATSNVHELPQYADRKKTKVIDGQSVTGWWVEDFTVDELNGPGSLIRARERIPQFRPNNVAFNDQYKIPTLQQVIDLAKAKSAETGRTIGVYPETKHPTYFKSFVTATNAANAGTPGQAPLKTMEDALVEVLHANYDNAATSPVFIQSFEVSNLRELNGKTNLRIAQLINSSGTPYDVIADNDPSNDAQTYAFWASAAGLDVIRTYADGIGAHKALVIPVVDGNLGTPTSLVADAHARDLLVHIWTMRAENQFLPNHFDSSSNPAELGNVAREIRAYLATGVDGFFTDHPDLGVAAVR